jgi:2-polyprenyl-6-hydroxyphenyl methylase/3-demethylubiquinone-9 3-methyltransferase
MDYYSEKLAGARLRECYDIAPARVQQYLDSEIRFVMDRLDPGGSVLELGCGYGRATLEFAKVARRTVGIDTATESLELAGELAGSQSTCAVLKMAALDLQFPNGEFDTVVCIQNGICAFGVDRLSLLRESLRVTRTSGRVLFSSYSDRFWPHRLHWFELQAERGLVGEIDYDLTGDGIICCKDGFRSGAMRARDFESMCAQVELAPTITEVDESSVFCEILP